MEKKDLVIKILIIVIILLIISLLTFKFVKKNGTKVQEPESTLEKPIGVEIDSFENKLRELIDSINFVNLVFNENAKYSDENSYINVTTSDMCKKYIGEDLDMKVNVLNTLYKGPFTKEKLFSLEENENDIQNLYVCLPTSCKIKEITVNDVIILDEKSDVEKKVRIGDKDYTIIKENEVWKLSDFVFLCEN